MKSSREKQLTILLLKEKVEKLSGKKVVFEPTIEEAKVAKLVEALEKVSGKKVVFEAKKDIKDVKKVAKKEVEEKEEEKEKKVKKKTVKESSWNEEELEEGWFGGKSAEEAKKEFLQIIGLWASKGYKKPSQEQFDDIMKQAEVDKFKGKLGVDNEKNIIYRPYATINWAAGKGHTFGGGA